MGCDVIDDGRDDSMRGTLGAAWIGDEILVWNCVDGEIDVTLRIKKLGKKRAGGKWTDK
jgi:hypothetical protein